MTNDHYFDNRHETPFQRGPSNVTNAKARTTSVLLVSWEKRSSAGGMSNTATKAGQVMQLAICAVVDA